MEGGLQSGRHFLANFADDCDQRGTTLAAFFRNCFTDALVAGRSHILLDFPKIPAVVNNRAEEDAAGVSRAYVVRYQAEDLINWSVNERGDYEWVGPEHGWRFGLGAPLHQDEAAAWRCCAAKFCTVADEEGTWLPLGCWTSASFVDAVGERYPSGLQPGARRLS